MVKFYMMMIQRGTITVEDVPVKWRAEVRAALEQSTIQ